MAHVVCQVLARPGRLSVVWSQGEAVFPPYHKTGPPRMRFLDLARRTRDRLRDLAAAAGADDVRRTGFALAQSGHDLYRELFQADAASQGTAGEVEDWF